MVERVDGEVWALGTDCREALGTGRPSCCLGLEKETGYSRGNICGQQGLLAGHPELGLEQKEGQARLVFLSAPVGPLH